MLQVHILIFLFISRRNQMHLKFSKASFPRTTETSPKRSRRRKTKDFCKATFEEISSSFILESSLNLSVNSDRDRETIKVLISRARAKKDRIVSNFYLRWKIPKQIYQPYYLKLCSRRVIAKERVNDWHAFLFSTFSFLFFRRLSFSSFLSPQNHRLSISHAHFSRPVSTDLTWRPTQPSRLLFRTISLLLFYRETEG